MSISTEVRAKSLPASVGVIAIMVSLAARVPARCRFFHRRSLLQSHAGFQPPVLHVIIRLERGIVPAVLERLSDLDRPEDLARWPGPLE